MDASQLNSLTSSAKDFREPFELKAYKNEAKNIENSLKKSGTNIQNQIEQPQYVIDKSEREVFQKPQSQPNTVDITFMAPIPEDLNDSEEEKNNGDFEYDRVSMILDNPEIQELSKIVREKKASQALISPIDQQPAAQVKKKRKLKKLIRGRSSSVLSDLEDGTSPTKFKQRKSLKPRNMSLSPIGGMTKARVQSEIPMGIRGRYISEGGPTITNKAKQIMEIIKEEEENY